MEKEFGKLTKQQFREVYSLLVAGNQLKQELIEESKTNKNNKLTLSLESVKPWAYWYDLPYIKHLAVYIMAIGLGGELEDINSKEDPQATLIELAGKDEPISIDEEDIANEELGLIMSLTISNSYQLESISIYGKPLSQLLESAKQGDDDALFRCIWVDRSFVFNPWVRNRIQVATFHDDSSFLSELARTISRTRPRKSKPELDDLRFMHQVLMDSVGRKKLSYKEQYKLLADDLELYPDEGKEDTFAGFKRLIQRKESKM